MIEPDLPKNESQRLEALKAYNILDTDLDESFDGITKLASQISGMPICLISLLDETRQWFKSHHGLDATETPRELSFCGHAINNQTEFMIVPNAQKDERFFDNPLVTGDPNVIFYGGAPLISTQGFPLGTLCVIDHKPNSLNPEQISALKLLSNQVIQLLELHKILNLTKAGLHTEKENYKTLFELSPVAFVILGEKGFIDCNNKALELFQIKSRAALIKLHPADISPKTQPSGEDSLSLSNILIEKTMHGTPQQFKWMHQRNNGDHFCCEVSLIKVVLNGMALVQASIRDLSVEIEQQELLKQSEEQFRLITSSATEGIILIDTKGMVTLWNQAAEKIFGYTSEEVMSKDLHSFIMPKRYGEQMKKGFTHFIKSGQGLLIGKTVETEGLHKSGKEFAISISVSAFKLNNEWHAAASIRDIQSQKLEQEKLQKSEEKFRGFTESSSDGIFEINNFGKLTYVNKMMGSFFDYDEKNELLGVHYQEIIAKEDIEKSKIVFNELLKGRKVEGDMTFKRKNNSYFSGSYTLFTSKLEKNINTGFTGRIRDNTDLQKYETIAKELRQFIETANAPIFGIDAKGKVNEWNQTSEKITGFKKEEVLGKDLVETYITEDYRDAVKLVLDNALKGKETANYEFPLFTKDGRRVMVLLNSSSRRDADGKIVGVLGVGQDISELDAYRTRTEAIAKELRQFIETANAPIFGIDEYGKVNEWNQTSEKITGFKKDEVLGKDLVETYITEDYRDAVKQVLDNALKGKETANYEFPLFTKDGRRVMVLLNSSSRKDADGKIVGVLGVGQDISELDAYRTRTEAIAKELRQFIETANAPIFGIDEYGKVNEWNQTSEKITGFKKEEVLGKDLVETYITDDYEKAVKLVLDNALKGTEAANFEFPLFTKGNQKLMVLLNASTRRDSDGKIVGVLGVGQDITELDAYRTRTEAIAKELRQFIETANAPIFGIDADGKVNEWNQTSEKITGFKKDEVLGKDLVETYITEDYRDAVKLVLDNALKGKETANYEFPLFTKDDRRIMVLLNSSSRRDAEGEIVGVLGVGQDISELDSYKNNLENLVKNRTLELENSLEREKELGKLKTSFVSMASHEFRTPLTAINAIADVILLYKEKLSKDEVEKRLIKIKKEVEDMAIMLDDILIIGKSDSQKLEFKAIKIDLVNLVKTIVTEYQLTQAEERDVIYKFSMDKIMLNADPKWIKHIVINLFSNAIKYSNSPASVRIDIQQEKNKIILSVSDQGIGISKKDQKVLFEPFHRGENVGNISGTGLGLTVLEKAVLLHKGKIGVISEIGKGTEISIHIPT
jgi:PAS domain S-box-containing protein